MVFGKSISAVGHERRTREEYPLVLLGVQHA